MRLRIRRHEIVIRDITARGRMGRSHWLHQRSRGVKPSAGRWKTVIGPKLKARKSRKSEKWQGLDVRSQPDDRDSGRPRFERTV
jgi:hypothetical protein